MRYPRSMSVLPWRRRLPPTAAPSERDLVALRRRFQEGDRDAFSALARPHLDALYTVCLRMLGSPPDAEDLAQEALVRALRAHHRFDPEQAFRPWLLAIGANLCRDRLKAAWWRREIRGVEISEAQNATTISAEDEAIIGEQDARVRAALATLPVAYREALTLYHLESMSYEEMSEITGATVAALKQRVRRGRGLLAEAVTRMYPDLVFNPTQG